ncbi:UNVERIFIED_CONTAM: hypothetical protein NCL1_25330 [Trichonephila clavipes]
MKLSILNNLITLKIILLYIYLYCYYINSVVKRFLINALLLRIFLFFIRIDAFLQMKSYLFHIYADEMQRKFVNSYVRCSFFLLKEKNSITALFKNFLQ